MLKETVENSRNVAQDVAQLTPEIRRHALHEFAQIISANSADLLNANQQDLKESQGISNALLQRLKLDQLKIDQLVLGIKDLANQEDPCGRKVSSTELDTDLILEKISAPIGVIAIVFESRPDVIPQVLSLILKSANVALLKGGKEAQHTNAAFMKCVDQLSERVAELPRAWAVLLDSREAFVELLQYDTLIDLVIPRGSNQLVSEIKSRTKIPVLGHADGVCHLYVHSSADLEQAIAVTLDAKTQYPSACNAIETLLVDSSAAQAFLPELKRQADLCNLKLKGCEHTLEIVPGIALVEEGQWHTEYGELILAVRIVEGPEAAILHINHFGSHHTDAIVAKDAKVIEHFVNAVDSACVFANASTRFADGYRFGLGAEVGISTARIHARGPVGVEGLVTYKYVLRGKGQLVQSYLGNNARKFTHKKLF